MAIVKIKFSLIFELEINTANKPYSAESNQSVIAATFLLTPYLTNL